RLCRPNFSLLCNWLSRICHKRRHNFVGRASRPNPHHAPRTGQIPRPSTRQNFHPGFEPRMSTGATLPLEAQFASSAIVGVGPRRRRRRTMGAFLVEAQMNDVAAFEFLGGAAAVFSARSPHKETPNEDAAAFWPVGQVSGVLAVADGLGGHAGGERAS